MEDVAKLKARYARALAKRNPWEAGYQDCYDYALPGRTSFFSREPGHDAPEIFDETAVIAVQEFSSRIQAGLIPNYSDFFDFKAGSEVPEDQVDEVNLALETAAAYVRQVISNSNFAQEANECLIDIALGTACLDVFEGDAINPVIFSAVPLPELAIDTGPSDEIDTYFRSRMMNLSHIETSYPGAKIPAELKEKIGKASKDSDRDDPKVKVVLGVYRDHEKQNEEANIFCVMLPEHDAIILKKPMVGAGSNRFIGFRWSKAAGEAWGRGPLFNTMAAVKTVNLVVQMVLENAEMAIAGIYTAEDDGVVNVDNIRLMPGTIIPVAPGSNGLRPVAGAGSFDVSQLVLSEMRGNIRKALYNETLGSPTGTPMSATEVAQRMADLSRQIGSAFGRLQIEFVNRVIARVVYILKKQNRIQLPVINGREVKIISTSPLSQAQAVEDINAVNNMLGLIGQHYGPQMVNLFTDGAEVSSYLRDKFGVPQRLVRSKADRAELAQNMATMQGQGETIAPETGQMPSL